MSIDDSFSSSDDDELHDRSLSGLVPTPYHPPPLRSSFRFEPSSSSGTQFPRPRPPHQPPSAPSSSSLLSPLSTPPSDPPPSTPPLSSHSIPPSPAPLHSPSVEIPAPQDHQAGASVEAIYLGDILLVQNEDLNEPAYLSVGAHESRHHCVVHVSSSSSAPSPRSHFEIVSALADSPASSPAPRGSNPRPPASPLKPGHPQKPSSSASGDAVSPSFPPSFPAARSPFCFGPLLERKRLEYNEVILLQHLETGQFLATADGSEATSSLTLSLELVFERKPSTRCWFRVVRNLQASEVVHFSHGVFLQHVKSGYFLHQNWAGPNGDYEVALLDKIKTCWTLRQSSVSPKLRSGQGLYITHDEAGFLSHIPGGLSSLPADDLAAGAAAGASASTDRALDAQLRAMERPLVFQQKRFPKLQSSCDGIFQLEEHCAEAHGGSACADVGLYPAVLWQKSYRVHLWPSGLYMCRGAPSKKDSYAVALSPETTPQTVFSLVPVAADAQLLPQVGARFRIFHAASRTWMKIRSSVGSKLHDLSLVPAEGSASIFSFKEVPSELTALINSVFSLHVPQLYTYYQKLCLRMRLSSIEDLESLRVILLELMQFCVCANLEGLFNNLEITERYLVTNSPNLIPSHQNIFGAPLLIDLIVDSILIAFSPNYHNREIELLQRVHMIHQDSNPASPGRNSSPSSSSSSSSPSPSSSSPSSSSPSSSSAHPTRAMAPSWKTLWRRRTTLYTIVRLAFNLLAWIARDRPKLGLRIYQRASALASFIPYAVDASKLFAVLFDSPALHRLFYKNPTQPMAIVKQLVADSFHTNADSVDALSALCCTASQPNLSLQNQICMLLFPLEHGDAAPKEQQQKKKKLVVNEFFIEKKFDESTGIILLQALPSQWLSIEEFFKSDATAHLQAFFTASLAFFVALCKGPNFDTIKIVKELVPLSEVMHVTQHNISLPDTVVAFYLQLLDILYLPWRADASSNLFEYPFEKLPCSDQANPPPAVALLKRFFKHPNHQAPITTLTLSHLRLFSHVLNLDCISAKFIQKHALPYFSRTLKTLIAILHLGSAQDHPLQSLSVFSLHEHEQARSFHVDVILAILRNLELIAKLEQRAVVLRHAAYLAPDLPQDTAQESFKALLVSSYSLEYEQQRTSSAPAPHPFMESLLPLLLLENPNISAYVFHLTVNHATHQKNDILNCIHSSYFVFLPSLAAFKKLVKWTEAFKGLFFLPQNPDTAAQFSRYMVKFKEACQKQPEAQNVLRILGFHLIVLQLIDNLALKSLKHPTSSRGVSSETMPLVTLGYELLAAFARKNRTNQFVMAEHLSTILAQAAYFVGVPEVDLALIEIFRDNSQLAVSHSGELLMTLAKLARASKRNMRTEVLTLMRHLVIPEGTTIRMNQYKVMQFLSEFVIPCTSFSASSLLSSLPLTLLNDEHSREGGKKVEHSFLKSSFLKLPTPLTVMPQYNTIVDASPRRSPLSPKRMISKGQTLSTMQVDYFLELILLYNACARGKSYDVEILCQTLYSPIECVNIVRSLHPRNAVALRSALIRFLDEVWVRTEVRISSISILQETSAFWTFILEVYSTMDALVHEEEEFSELAACPPSICEFISASLTLFSRYFARFLRISRLSRRNHDILLHFRLLLIETLNSPNLTKLPRSVQVKSLSLLRSLKNLESAAQSIPPAVQTLLDAEDPFPIPPADPSVSPLQEPIHAAVNYLTPIEMETAFEVIAFRYPIQEDIYLVVLLQILQDVNFFQKAFFLQISCLLLIQWLLKTAIRRDINIDAVASSHTTELAQRLSRLGAPEILISLLRYKDYRLLAEAILAIIYILQYDEPSRSSFLVTQANNSEVSFYQESRRMLQEAISKHSKSVDLAKSPRPSRVNCSFAHPLLKLFEVLACGNDRTSPLLFSSQPRNLKSYDLQRDTIYYLRRLTENPTHETAPNIEQALRALTEMVIGCRPNQLAAIEHGILAPVNEVLTSPKFVSFFEEHDLLATRDIAMKLLISLLVGNIDHDTIPSALVNQLDFALIQALTTVLGQLADASTDPARSGLAEDTYRFLKMLSESNQDRADPSQRALLTAVVENCNTQYRLMYGRVEVRDQNGAVDRLYFPIPPSARARTVGFLKEDIFTTLLNSWPDWNSAADKLEVLRTWSEDMLIKYEHANGIRTKRWVLSERWIFILEWFTFALSLLINLLVIGTFQGTGPSRSNFESWFYLVLPFGIIHLACALTLCIHFFIVTGKEILWICWKELCPPVDMLTPIPARYNELLVTLDHRFGASWKTSLYFYSRGLSFFLLDFRSTWLLTFLLFSILGVTLHFFFFAFHLLDLLRISPHLRRVVFTLKHSFHQLILMSSLILIFTWIMTIYAILFMSGYYSDVFSMYCTNAFNCFTSTLAAGLTNGGQTFQFLEPAAKGSSAYFAVFFYEILVYCGVAIILLNIVLATIVDAFGKRRDREKELVEQMTRRCFICSRLRESFATSTTGNSSSRSDFRLHVKYDHSIYHYLYLLLYLKERGSDQRIMNTLEAWISSQVRTPTGWYNIFPI